MAASACATCFTLPQPSTTLLGYIRHRKKCRALSAYDGFLHGSPILLGDLEGKSSSVQCVACTSALQFVAQIYAPLTDSQGKEHHRVLYLFSCLTKSCRRWRVLRRSFSLKSAAKSEEGGSKEPTLHTKSVAPSADLFEEVGWGSGSDDDDDGSKCEVKGGGVSSSAGEKGKERDEGEREEKEDVDAVEVPPASVDKAREELEWDDEQIAGRGFMSEHEKELLANYEKENGENVADMVSKQNKDKGDGDDEQYETLVKAQQDKLLLRYCQRVEENPGQVVRYSFGGAPLFFNRCEGEVPACEQCGGKRVFECQLLSTVLSHSKKKVEDDFGTVLVYSCASSCARTRQGQVWWEGSGWVEEWAAVQRDEPEQVESMISKKNAALT